MIVAAAALAAAPTEQAILRPADGAILDPGPLSIVARGKAQLRVDGKQVAAASPGPGAVAATVNPAPGLHELAFGDRKIRFFVGASEAPAGFRAYRAHPPAAAGCETCHAVKDGAWGFRGATLAASCFGCHDAGRFPEPHSHNATVLGECQLCHDPHGSTAKFHLKMDRETACKQCHG